MLKKRLITKKKIVNGTLLIAIKDNPSKNLYYGDELLIPAKFNPVNPPLNPSEFNFKNTYPTSIYISSPFCRITNMLYQKPMEATSAIFKNTSSAKISYFPNNYAYFSSSEATSQYFREVGTSGAFDPPGSITSPLYRLIACRYF